MRQLITSNQAMLDEARAQRRIDATMSTGMRNSPVASAQKLMEQFDCHMPEEEDEDYLDGQ